MKHYTDDDLVDYLHGELAAPIDALVHAHLGECVDCRVRCDAEAGLSDMLRASAIAGEREFPALIRAHVWASIRAAEPTVLDRLRSWLTPVVAVPIAAVVALGLYLGVPVLRGSEATGAPTISALYYLEEHAAEGQTNPLADHLSTNATLAAGVSAAPIAHAALIDAASAATLDDLVVSRE